MCIEKKDSILENKGDDLVLYKRSQIEEINSMIWQLTWKINEILDEPFFEINPDSWPSEAELQE